MGILRLTLALAVASGHAGFEIFSGDMAVHMFFIISGFYMALILSTRYDTATPVGIAGYYIARFLRLWPSYAIAAVMGFAWIGIILYVTGHPVTGPFVTPIQSPVWIGLIDFSNLTMVGQDVLGLFHVSKAGDVFLTFGPSDMLSDGSQSLGFARIVGPAWSIGTEIWFYLISPFLIRMNSKALVVAAVASLVLRFSMELHWGLNTYFFFPAQLCLFILGMLAYRVGQVVSAKQKNIGLVCLFVLLGAMLVYRCFFPTPNAFQWGIYILLFICIAEIFETFKNNLLDRWIGELSYPIYVFHAPIYTIFGTLYLKAVGREAPILLMLFLVVTASILAVLAVETPLDRFRHKLVRGAMKPGATVNALIPPVLTTPLPADSSTATKQ